MTVLSLTSLTDRGVSKNLQSSISFYFSFFSFPFLSFPVLFSIIFFTLTILWGSIEPLEPPRLRPCQKTRCILESHSKEDGSEIKGGKKEISCKLLDEKEEVQVMDVKRKKKTKLQHAVKATKDGRPTRNIDTCSPDVLIPSVRLYPELTPN